MTQTRNLQFQIPMSDPSRVGEVRREASRLAEALGFDETQQGRIAIVATELSNNIVKHAREGEVLIRALNDTEAAGLELLGIDRGPGMPDVGRCLRDGFSTAGTQGMGLGAIRRMSDVFDIHSVPGQGTVVLSRSWIIPPAAQTAGLDIGAVCLPVRGESECGDAWDSVLEDDRFVIMLADGLGHGTFAAKASQEALRSFRDHATLPPKDILTLAHSALRSTRGAAVSVAEIRRSPAGVNYCGIGNIGGTLVDHQGTRSMISLNGTLGHEARKFQDFSYPWDDEMLLILHSDGLASHWTLQKLPGILARHPSIIAGALYRDFRRQRDDATVIVARQI